MLSEVRFFRKDRLKNRFLQQKMNLTTGRRFVAITTVFIMDVFRIGGKSMHRHLSRLLLFVVLALPSQALSQRCECKTCKDPTAQRGPEWTRYWNDLRQRARERDPNPSPRNNPGNSQVVFLDFDTGKDSSFVYTQLQRDEIQANMEQIFDGYDVGFTQKLPTGDFSTIVFNSGGTGGLAEDIDFRNLNKNDNAVMNAEGLGLTPAELVTFSSNVASHELGHLMGLRHGDSFGPVGEGVLPPFGAFYDPPYLGPQMASEAFDHIMATPGVGVPLNTFFETLNWFGERSCSKLGYANEGVAVNDMEPNNTIATAQPLQLQTLALRNKIQSGVNAGLGDLSFSSAVVVGDLGGGADPVDIFQVDARAGDIFMIEVFSNSVDRLSVDPIDPNVGVVDENDVFIDYYGTIAFNEHEFESNFDCNIIDFILPQDGQIFIRVDSFVATDSGLYELYIYRFNGIHGDVNCDGDINLLDVDPFVDALLSGEFNPKADMNLDGLINLLDVDPFVALLTGD